MGISGVGEVVRDGTEPKCGLPVLDRYVEGGISGV